MDVRFLKKKYSFSPSSTRNEAQVPVLRSPSTDSQSLGAKGHRKDAANDLQMDEKVCNISSALIEEDKLTRELTRGAPTDSSGVLTPSARNPNEEETTRKRNQYFENSFSTREPHNAPRYRVNQDSIVIIEIKTNTRVCPALLSPKRQMSEPYFVLIVESR